jgi:hypothetical protein
MKYGNNMVVRQLELIRMSDIAMDLYSITAVLINLKKDKALSDAEKISLKRFVQITKGEIKEDLKELGIENKNDREDIKVADTWIKDAISK